MIFRADLGTGAVFSTISVEDAFLVSVLIILVFGAAWSQVAQVLIYLKLAFNYTLVSKLIVFWYLKKIYKNLDTLELILIPFQK